MPRVGNFVSPSLQTRLPALEPLINKIAQTLSLGTRVPSKFYGVI